jgi:hypothetical protein
MPATAWDDARVLQPQEIEAWRSAAADLGIDVEVRDDAVIVRDFGGAGMLCANRRSQAGIDDRRREAERLGMGWSALGPAYVDYDRATFIDALNDWGWAGRASPPSWYTGEPWTE